MSPVADSAGLLREAISLTENMIAAAGADDWEAVAALEADRATLLADSAEVSRAVGHLLEDLLALNRELETLAGEARAATAAALETLHRGGQAVGAYGSIGTG